MSEGIEISILRRYLHPVFVAALITTAKLWKQPERPSAEGDAGRLSQLSVLLLISGLDLRVVT